MSRDLPSAHEVVERRLAALDSEPESNSLPEPEEQPQPRDLAEKAIAYLEAIRRADPEWMLKVVATPIEVSSKMVRVAATDGLPIDLVMGEGDRSTVSLLGFVSGLLRALGCETTIAAKAKIHDGRLEDLIGFRTWPRGGQ